MAGPGRVRAAVVVTGDEVLHGRVSEANGAFLCRWLESRGVLPERVTVVPDDVEVIRDLVRSHVADGIDLVITSGGLGGTHDDVTMAAVAEAAGLPLQIDGAALATIEDRVRAFPPGRRTTPEIRAAANRKQASIPRGSQLLPPVGTAAGCVVALGGRSLGVVLPGPPFELRPMWLAAVTTDGALHDLLSRVPEWGRQVLRIAGAVETQMIEALEQVGPEAAEGVRLGICARFGELEVTLADEGREGAAGALADRLATVFGERVYSRDGSRVEAVVGALLSDAGQRVAVAESCTGGQIGRQLTSVAGASAWFTGGVVSYADRVKHDLLGVPEHVLARHGAVSEQTARAMAMGVRERLGTEWGLSVTGIAGPGGGTEAKPVGTVFVGCAGPGVDVVEPHRFAGDRERVRDASTAVALHLLRRALAGAVRGEHGTES